MGVLNRKPAAVRTPQRQALADAIAARAEAAARLEAARSAERTASDAVSAAHDAVAAAEAEMAAARERTTAHLIATARGEASTAPTSLRDARAAVTAAEDDLAAARDAFAAVREHLAALEKPVWNGPDAIVETAAREVIKSELPGAELIARIQTAQRALLGTAGVLAWLVRRDMITKERVPPSMDYLPEVALDRRFYSPPSTWNELLPTSHGGHAWEAAFEALMGDADAPLPLIAGPTHG